MAYLVLSEADQARFGCPSKLPFDPTMVTNKEAVELAKFGDWSTPRLWYRALSIAPMYLNPDGTTRMLGEGEAKPEGEPFDYVMDVLAWTGAVWMALNRVGVKTDLDTLEFDIQRLRIEKDSDDEPVPKDDTADEASSSTGTLTTNTGT